MLGLTKTHPVFIIGTGRSGTHWLGYSLGNHPDIRITVEEEPMFGWATQMALNPKLESHIFPRLVRAYKWQLFRSIPRLYLDKTHPNIWLAEKLKEAFSQALFIGIKRNPYATVASMMMHKGVSAWHKRWKEFPIPNRFLGISIDAAKIYDEIPFAAQCAMRWLAHQKQMNVLTRKLGESIKIIVYEDFACDPQKTVDELQHFLKLPNPIPVPQVKSDSLTKWKKQLTGNEIDQIYEIVKVLPDTIVDPSFKTAV